MLFLSKNNSIIHLLKRRRGHDLVKLFIERKGIDGTFLIRLLDFYLGVAYENKPVKAVI